MGNDAPKSGRAFVASRHMMYRLGIKSASGLTLPDFLGIGAQKAGTSWLYENLKAHPRAFLVAQAKEVHYFDKHFLDYDLEAYSRYFADGRGKIKGEITPAYSILPPRRIRYIRAVMPDVKLIFLMRNPIERAWSHAVMDLVTNRNAKFEDVSENDFVSHFHSPASQQRGDYETILDRWLAEFPRGQVFTGFFDDLARRPIPLLIDIFSHLGLPLDVDWSTFPHAQIFRKGQTAPLPPRLREMLLGMYELPIARLGERFGAPSGAWLTQRE